jgi:hypothetical protein
MRDRAYDEALYAYRSVGEGVFGALTVEFGDRLKTKKEEPTKTKTLLRIIICCLDILVRWAYEWLDMSTRAKFIKPCLSFSVKVM